MTRPMRAAAAAILILAGSAALLFLMGRPPICTCGHVGLWVGQANSSRTSQMLTDWYSASHIVHGFLFYAFLWLLVRRWPVERRFIAALILEATWEIVENTPMVINRYREATMALGFLAARKLPVWWAVAAVLLLELVPLLVIRDNLTLNVWMLLAPNAALK